ncbi:MAG: hypothetical protein AAFP20_08350 [Cyanobacteria bacterium J06614_10]
MAEINCAEACKDGCVLGDKCPHKDAQAQASKFIENTSLDTMLEMAEEAVRRKRMERAQEGPKWVFPEGGIQNDDAS